MGQLTQHKSRVSLLGLWTWTPQTLIPGFLGETSIWSEVLKTEISLGWFRWDELIQWSYFWSRSSWHTFQWQELHLSNMQEDPLLVKLDWILTSPSWTLTYPATFVQPLARPLSGHIPYVLHIGTSIPKSRIFRFEIFWIDHPGFLDTVKLHWCNSPFLPMLPGIYPWNLNRSEQV